MSLFRKTQSIHICVRLLMRWEMRFALHYYKYHITYSSRAIPYKEAAILSGSHWMCLHSHWMTPKPSFYTTFMMPHQTPVSHVLVLSGPYRKCTFWGSSYDSYLPLRIFQTLLRNSYATCLPSFLSFSRTHMHQSAQHGTRWSSLKSQSHTCSPTHRVHTHTHTCARSHTELVVQRWLYPELTKSARRENLVWTEKVKWITSKWHRTDDVLIKYWYNLSLLN